MALPSNWQVGWVAGKWMDLEGNPWVGKQINFALSSDRATVDGFAVVDGDGVTLTLDSDGQLSGPGVVTVGDWNVYPLPISADYDVQPVDTAILVTELMPGGAQYAVRVGAEHYQTSPLIVSSDMAEILLSPGAFVKPVWWQDGIAIPAGAVPGRDLLFDRTTTMLYAIVAD